MSVAYRLARAIALDPSRVRRRVHRPAGDPWPSRAFHRRPQRGPGPACRVRVGARRPHRVDGSRVGRGCGALGCRGRFVDRIHRREGRRRGLPDHARCALASRRPHAARRGVADRSASEAAVRRSIRRQPAQPEGRAVLPRLPPPVRPAGNGAIWSQTLALGVVYILLGLCSDSAYVLVGAHLGARLSGRATRLRAGRYAEGSILVGLGVLTLALPHRKTTK